MNLNLIRAIDKWVGIPACFFLSLVHRVSAWFKCKSDGKQDLDCKPERIVFIELSEMGSAILAYPAMKYAQGQYPEANLYFLVFEQNRFSVDILDIIPPSQVITINIFRAVRQIRRAKIDTVFDLELFSRFSSLLSGVSGASWRVGYGTYHEEGLYRGGFMTHRVFYNCHQHMAKNFLALVKAIELEDDYPLVKAAIAEDQLVLPRYQSSEKDLDVLRDRLAAMNPVISEAEHLVLLNPSAGRLLPIRAWSAENYGALAKRIIERFNVAIIVVGLEDAKAEAAKILDHVGSSRCIDFTGKTSFKDLFDLFNLADLLVTADSGPPHFAALTSIKTIVMFGPETPALYAPLGNSACLFADLACSPCLSAYNHRNTSCTDHRCMRAITVDEVFDKVAASLAG
jgi:ADP-heptose:LPS heptosyltransferase